jgi:hypothetical protein
MTGLSRELVENRLPIKLGFHPYKQPRKNYNPFLYDQIKEEVNWLIKASFICPCRYTEWVSNIVPVEKKGSGKIRVCVDFQNLNRVTPKDEYSMSVADLLINSESGNKVISFLNENADYNEIFMAEEDISKIAFICPSFICLFEWVVMTFRLKNVGATYQRVMNLIFHNLLGIIMEVYIDDVVVKSARVSSHLVNLWLAIEKMWQYDLKMNPLKCAFGVLVGRCLGFVIHEKGIEIDLKKVEATNKIKAPTCKKEVRSLLEKVNYL